MNSKVLVRFKSLNVFIYRMGFEKRITSKKVERDVKEDLRDLGHRKIKEFSGHLGRKLDYGMKSSFDRADIKSVEIKQREIKGVVDYLLLVHYSSLKGDEGLLFLFNAPKYYFELDKNQFVYSGESFCESFGYGTMWKNKSLKPVDDDPEIAHLKMLVKIPQDTKLFYLDSNDIEKEYKLSLTLK